MAVPPSNLPQPDRLADRLAAARERHFVGRTAHLQHVRQALASPDSPIGVIVIHGPGGVGKTTLLDAIARLAHDAGRVVISLDGRSISPSPAAFLEAVSAPPGTAPTWVAPSVLILDAAEHLAPLDAWLCEVFIPDLPSHVLVIIASRHPPRPAWRVDPGWADILRDLPLGNLEPDDARVYLRRRGVPEGNHDPIVAVTHGHPLALSLMADLVNRGDLDAAGTLLDHPDLIAVLLERFIADEPDPLRRRAVQACAHARVTTESLLTSALDIPDAADLFSWLRNLSFIEQRQDGLVPHDLARDVIDADLRWRDPAAYRDLHHRVREAIVLELRRAHGIEQQRAFLDLIFLHRHTPAMRTALSWSSFGTAWAEPATADALPAIVEMVRRHEGDRAAALARAWFAFQPTAFTIFRRSPNDLLGFTASFVLTADVLASDTLPDDPALTPLPRFLAFAGSPRPGEVILLHRFAIGHDTYQDPGPARDMVVMTTTALWLTTPRLAWSIVPVADPDVWGPLFAHINFRRSPEIDYAVDARDYAVFTHDWRVEPPLAWLDFMERRELNTTGAATSPPAPAPTRHVLDEKQFAVAVRQGLRNFHHPDALAANPLLRSRLLAGQDADPVAALRSLLQDAARMLESHPRDARLYRALHRTFFAPASTQEAAAEALDLPFSTYRYHLAGGIRRVTATLWQRELQDDPSSENSA